MHVLTFCEVASSRSFVHSFIHLFISFAAFMRRQVLSAVTLHDDKSASEYYITYNYYLLIGKSVKGKEWILMDGK